MSSITYDAGTNKTTVTGYSEETPCNFTDVYNADVAGGWGVWTKQGNSQFYAQCGLIIGDGSTATWFADTNKQITFSTDAPASKYIETMTNSNLILGNLVDASNKYTNGGCSIIVEHTSGTRYVLWRTGGVINLYSCLIQSPGSSGNIYGVDRVWNCLLGDNVRPYTRTQTDIENTTFFDYIYAAYSCDINDITILSSGALISLAGAQPHTISNVKGFTTGSNAAILSGITGDSFNWINFDLNKWTFLLVSGYDNSKIYRQYTVDIQVTDESGTPIEDALVTLTDQYDTEVFSVETDANGDIAQQTVTYKLYEPSSTGGAHVDETTYSPHTLTILANNYGDMENIFDVDEKIKFIIPLKTLVCAPIIVGNRTMIKQSYLD